MAANWLHFIRAILIRFEQQISHNSLKNKRQTRNLMRFDLVWR